MGRKALHSTRWTPPAETFNPRVLGSNPSRLTTIPCSATDLSGPVGSPKRRFDSHVASHGGVSLWTWCPSVDGRPDNARACPRTAYGAAPPQIIFAVWTIVAIACTASAVLGYVLLAGVPGDIVASMLVSQRAASRRCSRTRCSLKRSRTVAPSPIP